MTMMLDGPDLFWIRTDKDLISIAYTAKGGVPAMYCMGEEDCVGRTYIENLGRIKDIIGEDIGHPLSREDVFNIAKCCRETILSWSL